MKLYDQSCRLKTQDETKVVDSLGGPEGQLITSKCVVWGKPRACRSAIIGFTTWALTHEAARLTREWY